MAISEYEDAPRYAGSLPDGTDLEYSPHICAAEQHWATRAQIADLHKLRDIDSARLAHLERLEHQRQNAGIGDYGDEVAAQERDTMRRDWEASVYAQTDAEDEVAPPDLRVTLTKGIEIIAEKERLRTELEALRAFKASVPWEALLVLGRAFNYGTDSPHGDTLRAWYHANKPESPHA